MKKAKSKKNKVNNRDEFLDKLPFEPVSEISLERSIKLNCPHSMEVIRSIHRHQNIKEWRSAIMILKWLNGNTTTKSAKYVNRTHYDLLHHIGNMRNEFYTCDFRIVEKIRLIIHYCEQNPTCNEVSFKIQNYESNR